MRVEYKRHSKEPQWDLVKKLIADPLARVREQVNEELLRKAAEKNALVPIDRILCQPTSSGSLIATTKIWEAVRVDDRRRQFFGYQFLLCATPVDALGVAGRIRASHREHSLLSREQNAYAISSHRDSNAKLGNRAIVGMFA